MPEEDGLGFMQNLRKEFPDTKIIVISGASFEAGCHLKAAELMGAMRVVQKPVTKEKLLAIVEEQFKR
jgi:CheY-like chemotaxis protein